jgi:hypothetical protein
MGVERKWGRWRNQFTAGAKSDGCRKRVGLKELPNDFVGVEIAACLAEDHSWQSLPTWPGVTSAYDRIERNGCSFSATIVCVARMYVSSTLQEIPIRQPIRDASEPSLGSAGHCCERAGIFRRRLDHISQ